MSRGPPVCLSPPSEFTPEAVAQMKALATAMRGELRLKDRRRFMKLLRDTFKGRDAIAWFRCGVCAYVCVCVYAGATPQ
jgi:hypothetical protein